MWIFAGAVVWKKYVAEDIARAVAADWAVMTWIFTIGIATGPTQQLPRMGAIFISCWLPLSILAHVISTVEKDMLISHHQMLAHKVCKRIEKIQEHLYYIIGKVKIHVTGFPHGIDNIPISTIHISVYDVGGICILQDHGFQSDDNMRSIRMEIQSAIHRECDFIYNGHVLAIYEKINEIGIQNGDSLTAIHLFEKEKLPSIDNRTEQKQRLPVRSFYIVWMGGWICGGIMAFVLLTCD